MVKVVNFLACPTFAHFSMQKNSFADRTNCDLLQPLRMHVDSEMRPTLKNLPENLSADALKVKDPHCRENQWCNNGRRF